MYEKMADRLRDHGGQIHLQCPVQRILHEGFDVQGIELQNGRVEYFDHVVSTMPLTNLVRGLADVPADVRAAADGLQFRNTIFVYLHVDSDSLFADQWLYIHAPDLKMGRVTNFRNWVPQLHGEARTTILAVEHWCNDSDPIWTAPDDRLIEQATRELRSTRLLRDEPVLAGHVVRAAAMLSGLSSRLSRTHRANCRLLAQLSRPDSHRPLRDVQIQQPRSQHSDGHSGGRESVGQSRPTIYGASTRITRLTRKTNSSREPAPSDGARTWATSRRGRCARKYAKVASSSSASDVSPSSAGQIQGLLRHGNRLGHTVRQRIGHREIHVIGQISCPRSAASKCFDRLLRMTGVQKQDPEVRVGCGEVRLRRNRLPIVLDGLPRVPASSSKRARL